MNIFLNSRDKSSGDFSSFICDFNNQNDFFNLKKNEKLRVRPEKFQILNDFENINQYNQTFKLIAVNNSTTLQTITITIPTGYYDVFSLRDELENQLLVEIDNAFPNEDWSIQVLYLDNSNKYQINIIEQDFFSSGNKFILQFDNEESTLANFLGYKSGQYFPEVETSTSNVFLSIQPINIIFQSVIYVKSNLVYNNLENNTENLSPSRILFTLTQDVEKNAYLIYENPGNQYITDSIPTLNNIEISFVDYLDRPILFKSNCFLTLHFEKEQIIQTFDILEELIKKSNSLQEINLLQKTLI